jgi:hypothetical protein
MSGARIPVRPGLRAAALAAILIAAFPPGPAAAAGETGALPPSAPAGARLFQSWEFAGSGGVLLPLGGLADVLDPAPLAGFRAVTSYYGSWRAFGTFSAARLDGPRSPAAVGLASLAAGLEWRPSSAWAPAAGGGLGLHYVRALESIPGETYYFLSDGETEFGLRGHLRWGLAMSSSLALEAGASWDLLFTGPEYSHLAAFLVGIAWTP